MTNLKNHPGYWLNPEAAASLERLESAHGRVPINSAGRTEATQQNLINRYDRGGAANRPPHLFNPARPARASRHVIDGGLAIDTSAIAHMLKYGPEFGWYQNFAYDPVHFEYDPSRDKHRGGTPTTGNQKTKQEQQFLNQARGEKLKVDGIDGSATQAAVKRYQEFLKKGYGYRGAIDGKWGAGTQAAHSTFYAVWSKPKTPGKHATKRSTIRKGSRSKDVGDLQRILNKNYPAYSKLKVDDQFGTGTENVVKEFQRRVGLKADGIVGPATWAKLGQ